jgi:hypothetical protein
MWGILCASAPQAWYSRRVVKEFLISALSFIADTSGFTD